MTRIVHFTSENEIERRDKETGFPSYLAREWNGLRQRPKISHSSRHNLKVILTQYINSRDYGPDSFDSLLDDIYRLVRHEIHKTRTEDRRNKHREV